MRRTLSEYLADGGHWAGCITDEVLVEKPTVWLHLPARYELYAWPWTVTIARREKQLKKGGHRWYSATVCVNPYCKERGYHTHWGERAPKK